MFNDIGLPEMLIIIVVGVIVFGPDKLPKMIQDTMGFIRKVRSFADSAKADIRKELGPEFKDFEFEDLNPKTFVRKTLLNGDELGLKDELKDIRDGFDLDVNDLDPTKPGRTVSGGINMTKSDTDESLPSGERPPYDVDAT